MRYKDIPNQEGCEGMSDADKEKVMHVALPINDGNVLMATDAVGKYAEDAVFGNNISLSVSADSKEEADKIYNGLANGGEITMPLADAFWARISECVRTNSAFNGWSITTRIKRGK